MNNIAVVGNKFVIITGYDSDTKKYIVKTLSDKISEVPRRYLHLINISPKEDEK